MNILTNKYFILGNLLLLLISIPITLFFIARQQELRGRAAPSSRLSFSPENPSTSTQCQSFNADIMVDPGSNIVSIVDFYLKYDPTKLDVLQMKESDKFPTVIRPVSVSSGESNMSVSVGADVTLAVQTVAKVATVTFHPKSAGTAQIQFDQTRSRVFSLAPADEPTENVLFQVSPANVTIGTGACAGVSITPSPTTSIIPTIAPTTSISPTPRPASVPTSTPTPTSIPTATPTATVSATTTPSPTGQVTPTPIQSGPTSVPTSAPTLAPTAGPTIPPTGGVIETIGIIGAIILVIVGGLALLAL